MSQNKIDILYPSTKQMYQNKSIPQNYLIEEILLGAIMIYPEIIANSMNILKKEHFFLEFHGFIYINLLEQRIQKYSNIDLLYKLTDNQKQKGLNGYKKIIHMMRQSQIFIGLYNKKNYIIELISSLNDMYIRRLIIQCGYNIIQLGYTSSINNKNIYHKLLFYVKFIEIEINKHKKNNRDIVDVRELLSSKLLNLKYPGIREINKLRTHNKIINSGFKEIDLITNGLPNGNLIVIAGRPSVGKTSLAINIAYNTFLHDKISICMFSLEMSSQEILHKIISISCNLDMSKATQLSKDEWTNIIQICKKLLKHNIYLNDKYNIDIRYIEYIAQNLKSESEIHLIIIDYLQLIDFQKKNNQKLNRSQELGYITRRLKLLAQLLKLPIIVLSQLNRNIETRNDKEPLLSDLRESGCINYTNNISTQHKFNKISIINYQLRNSYSYLKTGKYKTRINNMNTSLNNSVIYLSNKNLFYFLNKKHQLSISHNHRYLSKVLWIQLHKSTKSTKFNSIQNKQFNGFVLIKENYVSGIRYINHLRSYDISLNNEFHLVSHNVILHNSIEQDADIVLILQNQMNKTNNLGEKNINIKISKNRNGQTGSCTITFISSTGKFKSII